MSSRPAVLRSPGRSPVQMRGISAGWCGKQLQPVLFPRGLLRPSQTSSQTRPKQDVSGQPRGVGSWCSRPTGRADPHTWPAGSDCFPGAHAGSGRGQARLWERLGHRPMGRAYGGSGWMQTWSRIVLPVGKSSSSWPPGSPSSLE